MKMVQEFYTLIIPIIIILHIKFDFLIDICKV